MNKDIERKIAIIFVTDVVSFSKMMEKNEDETLRSFRLCRDILDNLFQEYGILLETLFWLNFKVQFPL